MQMYYPDDQTNITVRDRRAARTEARRLIAAGSSPDEPVELFTEVDWGALHPGVDDDSLGEQWTLGSLALEAG